MVESSTYRLKKVGQNVGSRPEATLPPSSTDNSKRDKKFSNWMSLPRTAGPTLLVPPAFHHSPTFGDSCPQGSIVDQVRTKQVAARATPYRLLDMEIFECMDEILASGTKDELADFLERHKTDLWPAGRVPAQVQLSEAAWAAVRGWYSRDKSPRSPTNPDWLHHDRRFPWVHANFLDPDRDFKRHLAKRLRVGLEYGRDNGNQVGGVTVRLMRVGPFKDSSFDASLLFDNLGLPGDRRDAGGRKFHRAGLEYNAFSTSNIGTYAGFGWIGETKTSRLVSVREETRQPDGASTLTDRVVVVTDQSASTFEVRAGVAAQIKLPKVPFFTIRAGLSGPFRRKTENTFGLPAKLDSVVRFTFTVRVFPFKASTGNHPLAR